jgi:hypothetical protein
MTLEQIAAAHWTNGDAAKALGSLVTSWLDEQPQGQTFGTSEVMRALGATTGLLTRLSAHISNARKDGICDGYFEHGKKGPFGKPVIVWHAAKPKAPMSREDKLAWMKQNDPETYALLYGSEEA